MVVSLKGNNAAVVAAVSRLLAAVATGNTD
jgi:hypothetical protein